MLRDIGVAFGENMKPATAPMEELSPRAEYVAQAVYFLDSDCVEYVRNDAFCVYERIDDFLTLVLDESRSLVGFKLKGFKWVFDTHLKPLFELHDRQFIELVSAIELYFTAIGNEIFEKSDETRMRAYRAALVLAANDKVKLPGEAIFRAAA